MILDIETNKLGYCKILKGDQVISEGLDYARSLKITNLLQLESQVIFFTITTNNSEIVTRCLQAFYNMNYHVKSFNQHVYLEDMSTSFVLERMGQ